MNPDPSARPAIRRARGRAVAPLTADANPGSIRQGRWTRTILTTVFARVVTVVAVATALLVASAPPASARTDAEFWIGAPVDGHWASSIGCPAPFPSPVCADPRSHSVDYAALDGTPERRSWAVDLGGSPLVAGTGGYLYVTPYASGVALTTRVDQLGPACAPGTGRAGRVVVVGIYHGSRKVGTVAYAHVKPAVTQGQVVDPRGTKIGTVADTSAPTSCSQPLRLHVEMGNTNNYSCFARDLHTGRPWGGAVHRGDFIGWVGGRRATGSRQPCPY